MAASTANQKVFVPLQGVLKVQDEVRHIEQMIDDSNYSHDQKVLWRHRHDGLKFAIETLDLPIVFRNYAFSVSPK